MAGARDRGRRRRSDDGHGETGSSPARRSGAAGVVLALQRSAGNRATQQLLARYYDEHGTWIEGDAPKDYVSFTVDSQTRFKPAVTTAVDVKPDAADAKPAAATVVKDATEEKKPAPATATGPTTVEPPREDHKTIWLLDVSKLRYSQDSIDYWYGPKNAQESIVTAARETKKDAKWFDRKFEPVQITKRRGRYISIDNRRVWIAKHGGLATIRVTWAPPERVDQREFTGGKEGAAFIQVRGLKRSDLGSLPILEPPASQKMDARERAKYM